MNDILPAPQGEYPPATPIEIEALKISFTGGDISSRWIQRLIATIEEKQAENASIFECAKQIKDELDSVKRRIAFGVVKDRSAE